MYGIGFEEVDVAKFNVGDKVRVMKDGWGDGGSYHGADVGDIDEIINIDLSDRNPYEGKVWFYQENEIELAPPEPKFKIGDRVRVIDDRGGGKIGDIGQVTDVDEADGDTYYWLLGLSNVSHQHESRLELAPACAERKVEQDNAPVPVAHTKAQPKFKAGDVVNYKSSGRGAGTIKCLKTKWGLNESYDGPTAYDYEDGGWDYETSLVLAPSFGPCIIARVDNGKPTPSRYPHVHASVADATAEAERLARNNPGTEFAVYQRVAGRVAEQHIEMKEVA